MTTSSESARFVENLGPQPRQLWWLATIIIVSVLGGAAYAVPFVFIAFCYSLLRFRLIDVRVETHSLLVGKRVIPLLLLDPTSVGNPRNTWPWLWFSKRRIAAVPFWTKGSIGITGRNAAGKSIVVSLGTNHKEELIAALTGAINAARQLNETRNESLLLPASRVSHQAGWFADPWDPVRTIRYFDGNGWTGWILPAPHLR